MAVPPTSWLLSYAPRLRSNSNRVSVCARSSGETGEPWNACWSISRKLSNSSGVTGRIG